MPLGAFPRAKKGATPTFPKGVFQSGLTFRECGLSRVLNQSVISRIRRFFQSLRSKAKWVNSFEKNAPNIHSLQTPSHQTLQTCEIPARRLLAAALFGGNEIIEREMQETAAVNTLQKEWGLRFFNDHLSNNKPTYFPKNKSNHWKATSFSCKVPYSPCNQHEKASSACQIGFPFTMLLFRLPKWEKKWKKCPRWRAS